MKRSSFKLISVAAIVLIAMFVLTRAARAGSYTYTTIDDPSAAGGSTYALGINDYGNIVGYYTDSSGETKNGFLYNVSTHTYTKIDDPNGNGDTRPTGINDRGDIVGYYVDNSGDHGFLYSGSTHTFTTLDDPNAVYGTYAAGINDYDHIVGYYYDGNFMTHGFLYNVSTHTYAKIDDPSANYTTAFGINDNGEIVGCNAWGTGFLYSGGVYTTPEDPAGIFLGTAAFGINDYGDYVGNYVDTSGDNHGFLYDSDTRTYTTIDDPNGHYGSAATGRDYNDLNYTGTEATGVDYNCDIVGYYTDSSGNTHGFLATQQTGGLWQNVTPMGDGWYYLSWFGRLYTGFSPWIYHAQLGWLYPFGTSADNIWFYDSSMNAFLWTSATDYPYFYRAGDKTWLYYNVGSSNPQWFYNFKSHKWESH